MMNTTGARRDAFTLVEMVVVLGIVSLLMSILLPALSLAQRKARMTTCANNLRQIGHAVVAYRADHSDFIPSRLAGGAPVPGSGGWWGLAPAAYADAPPASDALQLGRYLGSPDVLSCPEAADPAQVSYGVNGQVLAAAATFRQLREPGAIPFVFDTAKPVGYYYSDLAKRHFGCANMLYSDNRVESQYVNCLYGFYSAIPLPGPSGPGSPSDEPGSPGETAEPSGATFALTLRVAGKPWRAVDFVLRENGNLFAAAQMERLPGNPNEQTQDLGPYFLDPANRTYTLEIALAPEEGENGGNPVWIVVNDGAKKKLTTLNRKNPFTSVDITSILAAAQ